MAKASQDGFHVPNSTIALMLVLTIVFMVWSFAVINTSLSGPVAPVTGADAGPQTASIGFWIGGLPSANNPVQSGEARLTIVESPQGEE